jgi:hypothetical protein
MDDPDATRRKGWEIRNNNNNCTLLDPFGAYAGTLRRDIAEHVVAAVNYYSDKMRDRDAQIRYIQEQAEERERLAREGIGGARVDDTVIVKTSRGPYQGVVRELLHYVNKIFVEVDFPPRARRPDEYHVPFASHRRGVLVEASAIISNVTRKLEAE